LANRSVGVLVGTVFSDHQPEIFGVFLESVFELRNYSVQGFVIVLGCNGSGA
jgi:hypothetical protein